MKYSYFHQVLEILSDPYKFTKNDRNKFWTDFLTLFKKFDKEKNYVHLNNLLLLCNESFVFVNHEIDNSILKELITYLYNFITRPNFEVDGIIFDAVFVLQKILPRSPVEGLELPWRPMYNLLISLIEDNPKAAIIWTHNVTNAILAIAPRLSGNFPPGTSKDLFNTFLPKISPRGLNVGAYLTILANLYPKKDENFEQWISIIAELMIDLRSKMQAVALLKLAFKIMVEHVEYDFSVLMEPFLTLISGFLLNDGPPSNVGSETHRLTIEIPCDDNIIYLYAARILVLFLASPATRENAKEKYSFILNSALLIVKDSRMNSSGMQTFVSNLIDNFYNTKRRINKGKYPKSVDFSEEEMTTLLKPIVDILIATLMTSGIRKPIGIIKTFSTFFSLTDKFTERIFDFSMECLNFTDSSELGNIGWNLMATLVLQAPKFDFIRKEFPRIYDLAVENFGREDVKFPVTLTIYAMTNTFVFNTEKPIKGFEDLDYPTMAYNLANAYFDAIQKLPAYKEKQAHEDSDIIDIFHSIFYNIFALASKDVFEKVYPLVLSVITNPDYSHVNTYVILFLNKFFIFADNSMWLKTAETMREKLRNVSNRNTIIYYLDVCTFIHSAREKTKEGAKAIADEIFEFTKNSDKKIQKCAWRSLSAIFSSNPYYSMKIEAPGPPTEFFEVKDFKIKEQRKMINFADLAYDYYKPIFDIMLNEKDPNVILGSVKPALKGLFHLFLKDPFVTAAEDSEIPEIFKLNLFSSEPYVLKSHPVKDKFIECVIRILRDFPDCPTLLEKIIKCSETLYTPMASIKDTSTDFVFYLNNLLFPYQRVKKIANFSIVQSVAYWIQQRRITSHPIPPNKAMRQLSSMLIDRATSKYRTVRGAILINSLLSGSFYSEIYEEPLRNKVAQLDNIPTDEFLDLVISLPIFQLLCINPKMLCDVIYRMLSKFDIEDQNSIQKFKVFLLASASDPQHFDKTELAPFYELLEKVQKLLEATPNAHKNFHFVVLVTINIAIKVGVKINTFFVRYLFEQGLSCDPELCFNAHVSIKSITKLLPYEIREKKLEYKPKLEEFSNPLKACTLEFDENYPFDTNPTIVQHEEPPIPTQKDQVIMMIKEMLKQQGVTDEVELQKLAEMILQQGANLGMLQDAPEGQEEELLGPNEQPQFDDKEDVIMISEEQPQNVPQEEIIDKDEIDGMNDDEILEMLENGAVPEEKPQNANNESIAAILDSIDHMKFEIEDPRTPELFKSQSAGYLLYPENYESFEYLTHDLGISDKEIADFVIKFCASDSNDFNISNSFSQVIGSLTPFFNVDIINMIADKVHEILLKPLTSNIVLALIGFITGVLDGVKRLDFEAYKVFSKRIAIPVICISSLSPQYDDEINEVFSACFLFTVDTYVAPIIKIMFELSNNLPEESTVITRSMFCHLNTLLFVRPTVFYSAINEMTDKLLTPFFKNIASFPRSISSEFICTFVSLVESTCVRESSPLYSPELKEKRDKLVDDFDKALSTADINDKAVQGVIIAFLSYTSTASNYAVSVLAPVIMKHLKLIFMAGNSTDEQTELLIFASILDFTMHPYFVYEPKLLVEYIDLMFSYLSCIACPLQDKMIANIFVLLTANTVSLNKENLHHLFDIVYAFAAGCKNEDIKYTATLILGRVIIQMNEKIELNELTAASVINATQLIDEASPLVIDALNVIKDILENSSRSKKSFLERTITDFWKHHIEQITPKVQKDLEPYMTLVPPSYIT